MDKIHLESVIKSFFLGLFIGIVLLFYHDAEAALAYKTVTVLASGSLGFLIGWLTEWLTALLPIRIANSRTYFFINNLLALIVTTFIMASFMLITGSAVEDMGQFMPTLLIVLGVVCVANLGDYMMYRRAQHKLQVFKASMKDE